MDSDEFSKLLDSFNSNSSSNIKTHNMSNKYTIRYIKKTPPKTKVKQISYFIKFENGEIHVLTYSNLQRILYNIDANPTIYQNIQIFKVKTYNKLSVLEFTKLLAQKHLLYRCII